LQEGRIPTIKDEDTKRSNRERDSLVGKQSRIVDRMKAALARPGIRNFNPKRPPRALVVCARPRARFASKP